MHPLALHLPQTYIVVLYESTSHAHAGRTVCSVSCSRLPRWRSVPSRRAVCAVWRSRFLTFLAWMINSGRTTALLCVPRSDAQTFSSLFATSRCPHRTVQASQTIPIPAAQRTSGPAQSNVLSGRQTAQACSPEHSPEPRPHSPEAIGTGTGAGTGAGTSS